VNSCGISQLQCNQVTCDSVAQSCSLLPLAGPCTDYLDLCSEGNTCSMGTCVGGTPKDCSALDGPCSEGVCDPENGECVAQKLTSDDCQWDLVLDAVSRGWWREDGAHDAGNDNTYTGDSSGLVHNSYFSFDLSGVNGTVVAVALVLEQESYFGTDESEKVTLWDVKTSAATLEASGPNQDVFHDLQIGASYGVFECFPGDSGTTQQIPLDSPASADVTAALGGFFSVGLHTQTADDDDQGVRFSDANEPRVHQLLLDLQ
jgi:hypothetical protein